MNQEKFWKFSKLKPLENRIHENIQTLLDKRKIQKKKKNLSLNICITVLQSAVI